jgi:hypothetical protein
VKPVLALVVAMVAATVLAAVLHAREPTRLRASPICVDTSPLYVEGHEVLPATEHCTPTT